MRITSLLIIFILGLIMISCEREELHDENPANVDYRSDYLINDHSGWELTHVFDLMSNIPDQELTDFLQFFGQPDWEASVQRRGSEINITTIPVVKNDSITGIIKVYNTDEDVIKTNFFPTIELDEAITQDLNTQEYHMYNGAIQSLIICSYLKELPIDGKYWEWLESNKSRMEERVRWICIEEWDCVGIYTSDITGWNYDDSVDFNPIWNGNNGAGNSNSCTLLSRECWVDWTPRDFPGSSSGGQNWNNDTSGNGLTGGNSTGGNGSNGNGTNSTFENTVRPFINNWLGEHHLSEDYFDLIANCTEYLPHPFDPNTPKIIMDADCVEEVLPCLNEAASFLDKYGLNLSYDELGEILGGYGENCQSQLQFEIKAIESITLKVHAEILDIISMDPLAFFENCQDVLDTEIPGWEDLASFVPGEEIQIMLDERGDGEWSIQTIADADGPVLNIDYFGVTFTNFPNGMDAESFFTYVQQNFGLFDDGCNSAFNFNDDSIDGLNWVSNDPTGSIFDINIYGPDEGAVMASQFDNSPDQCFCWTFTTITNDVSGEHPVSGNRQFGLTQNEDGTWTFYIRGVDRATDNILWGLNTSIGFSLADKLWGCIINNIQDFIDPSNSNSVTFGHHVRPDWDKIVERILDLGVTELLDCVSSSN